jgi:putative transposase
MANTYSQIYIQAIFAVEHRAGLIQSTWKEELFKYIGGIFRNKKQKLIAIGGIEDHIHLLIRSTTEHGNIRFDTRCEIGFDRIR